MIMYAFLLHKRVKTFLHWNAVGVELSLAWITVDMYDINSTQKGGLLSLYYEER